MKVKNWFKFKSPSVLQKQLYVNLSSALSVIRYRDMLATKTGYPFALVDINGKTYSVSCRKSQFRKDEYYFKVFEGFGSPIQDSHTFNSVESLREFLSVKLNAVN